MKAGDIVLARLPQAQDFKSRPALVLKLVPPFNDFLVCGISTQLDRKVEGLDEIIEATDDDFVLSSLKKASLIRGGFLVALPPSEIIGKLGEISLERHQRLLRRLSDFLSPEAG